MSKKDSIATMQRAIDKAKAQKARDEEKSKRADKKAAKLHGQVRQIEVAAARAGVDLNALPTKKQTAAEAPATKTKTEQPAEQAPVRRQTADRIAEHIEANTFRSPHYVTHYADRRPTSAEKLAHQVVVGLESIYADPSRNALPTGPFLRPTREVLAGQRPGQPMQPQYRQPAQTRTVSPQATTRSPLHRRWGAAPGQLGGVKTTDRKAGGR